MGSHNKLIKFLQTSIMKLALLSVLIICCFVSNTKADFITKPLRWNRSRGCIAQETQGGKECQNWKSDYPNAHSHNDVGNHNYCRNPDDAKGESHGSQSDYGHAWCYIEDNDSQEGGRGKRWDYCDCRMALAKKIKDRIHYRG